MIGAARVRGEEGGGAVLEGEAQGGIELFNGLDDDAALVGRGDRKGGRKRGVWKRPCRGGYREGGAGRRFRGSEGAFHGGPLAETTGHCFSSASFLIVELDSSAMERSSKDLNCCRRNIVRIVH